MCGNEEIQSHGLSVRDCASRNPSEITVVAKIRLDFVGFRRSIGVRFCSWIFFLVKNVWSTHKIECICDCGRCVFCLLLLFFQSSCVNAVDLLHECVVCLQVVASR